MIIELFKNKKEEENNSSFESLIKITALLIHVAKIDENYTDKEKKIIKEFVKISTKKEEIDSGKIEELIKKAEHDEKNSNQILEYTKEIKNYDLNYRKSVLTVLWSIILSDNNSDIYENNLMRRICGLLYIPDKLSGEIKLKLLKNKK